MFLYLGGVWTPAMFVHPLYVQMPPVHSYPPGVYTPPIGPMLFFAPCMVLEHLHVVAGLLSAFSMCWDTSLTPPIPGGASPLITPPTLSCWFPVQCCSQGYRYLMWAFSPSVEGFGCVPPSLGVVWGAHQLFSCPYAHSCTFFV